MADRQRAQVEKLAAQLEELWGHLDAIFDSLDAEGWARQHGPDWIFADVPYHLSYFDEEVIARPLEAGPDLPAGEQTVLQTIAEVNDWNEAQFAERPESLTVSEALQAMENSREACRQAMAAIDDDKLSRSTWFPFHAFSGWRSARFTLENCRGHTFAHVMELRLRLNQEGHRPGPELIHACMGFLLASLRAFVNRDAGQREFTVVHEFSGPGGGSWTLHAAGGAATVRAGGHPSPDLVLTQTPETFFRTLLGMHDPAEAMRSGQIQVSSFEALPAFGQLMAPPELSLPLKVLEF